MSFLNTWNKLKWPIPFVSSCLAELCAFTILLPSDMVRARFQINSPHFKYSDFFNGLATVFKSEGFFRLYRGS